MARRNAENDDLAVPDRRHSPAIISTVRIVEAVVIAAMTALLVHVYSIPKIEEKLETMAHQIIELKQENAEFRRDFYAPRNGKLAAYEPIKEENGK
jgi:hypothetical protein